MKVLVKNIRLVLVGIGLAVLPIIASAHSFGALYNLPVPFWMYLYGGAGSMVISFIIFAYFFDKKPMHVGSSEFPYKKTHFLKLDGSSFVTILKVVSFLLFLLTVLSGFIGENSSYSNFNMTFFWVIIVLGLTYLAALVGDIYSFLNPWKIVTDLLVGKDEKPILQYPKFLSYYPALFFYFVFIWFELVGNTTPLKLSFILIIYTIINDLGVIAYGREAWYKYCEFFSVFFRLIGKIAPFEYGEGKVHLRLPFVGLLKERAESLSLVLFTLFMLSSTAFDGFKETVYWFRFYWKFLDEFMRPLFGTSSYAIFETVGLALSLVLFYGVYMLLIYLSRVIAQSHHSLKDLALNFAFSLIPIALVYNIAHYYTIIFSEGPNIFRLILDPFGFGWNFFGVEGFPSSLIVGANFVWHSQVGLILAGHIVSVYLTHKVAQSLFFGSKRTFVSQVPMLVLMIVYTMAGLWILSQPLTGGVL